MGTLHYGNEVALAFDDVTLQHLMAVTVAKLRRTEPFVLTVLTSTGRESLWVHPASMMRCVYDGRADAPLDRDRLEAMVRETNRAGGLVVHAVDAPGVAAVAA